MNNENSDNKNTQITNLFIIIIKSCQIKKIRENNKILQIINKKKYLYIIKEKGILFTFLLL